VVEFLVAVVKQINLRIMKGWIRIPVEFTISKKKKITLGQLN